MMKNLRYFIAVVAFVLTAGISTQLLAQSWYNITDAKYSDDGETLMYCNYEYKSVDERGEEITLSAFLMCGPKLDLSSGKVPQMLDDVVLMHHYTIYDDQSAPTLSQLKTFDLMMLGNNLVIAPDYEGFGASKDRHQMYLIHALHGRQAFDALTAGKQIFDDKAHINLRAKWQLYLAGASQGAANAVATQRYMETEGYDQEWRLAKSVVCDGPYCPTITVQKMLDDPACQQLLLPLTVPIAVKALFLAWPEELKDYQEADFYCPEFQTLLPELDAAMQAHDQTLKAIEDRLLKAAEAETGVKAYDSHKIFSAELFDADSPIRQTLMACLAKSDLNTGWTPKHPIQGYACAVDDIVPNANSDALAEAFGSMFIADDYSESVKLIAVLMGNKHMTAVGGFLGVASLMQLNTVKDYIEMGPTHLDAIQNLPDLDAPAYDLYGRQTSQQRGVVIRGGKLKLVR